MSNKMSKYSRLPQHRRKPKSKVRPPPKEKKAPQYRPGEEPSLADLFVAATHTGTTKWGRDVADVLMQYRITMRHAHNFVLTDEFVDMATELSYTTPEKTLARVQYATLPYDTTWIEFNLRAKMSAIARITDRPVDLTGVSDRLGLLLQRIDDTSAVCTLVPSNTYDNIGEAVPNTTCYFFSTTEIERFQPRFGCRPIDDKTSKLLDKDPELAKEAVDLSKATLWGYSTPSPEQSMDINWNTLRVPEFLYRHGEIGVSRIFTPLSHRSFRAKDTPMTLSEIMVAELREYTGTVRWLVTVLAMMNEVPIHAEPVVRQQKVRATRTHSNRMLDYHKVSLILPKVNPVAYYEKKLRHADIRRRRAHEVRAHWRTYLHETRCGYEQHEWVYDHENGYRLCAKCEAYGRLIHEHIRGDANLGWVRKDYVVKAAT